MHDNEAKDILEDKFATLSRSLIWFEMRLFYGPQAPIEEDNNSHEERKMQS
jgi:hypothetical protein